MIAPDSFVRAIDFFVDAIDLASFGFKNITLKEEGRPPYHPSVLLKPLSSRIYNNYLLAQECGFVVGICNPNFLYSSDL